MRKAGAARHQVAAHALISSQLNNSHTGLRLRHRPACLPPTGAQQTISRHLQCCCLPVAASRRPRGGRACWEGWSACWRARPGGTPGQAAQEAGVMNTTLLVSKSLASPAPATSTAETRKLVNAEIQLSGALSASSAGLRRRCSGPAVPPARSWAGRPSEGRRFRLRKQPRSRPPVLAANNGRPAAPCTTLDRSREWSLLATAVNFA